MSPTCLSPSKVSPTCLQHVSNMSPTCLQHVSKQHVCKMSPTCLQQVSSMSPTILQNVPRISPVSNMSPTGLQQFSNMPLECLHKCNVSKCRQHTLETFSNTSPSCPQHVSNESPTCLHLWKTWRQTWRIIMSPTCLRKTSPRSPTCSPTCLQLFSKPSMAVSVWRHWRHVGDALENSLSLH